MKVFVSYSRSTARDIADAVEEALTGDGHDIFTDVNDIRVGSFWSSTIEKNITDCDIFIIVITHAALRSPHVEKEILQAQRENKIIIPCIYEHVASNEIKWNLGSIQGIEFDDKYELARSLSVKIAEIQRDSEKDTNDINTLKQNSGIKKKRIRNYRLKMVVPVIVGIAVLGLVFAFTVFGGSGPTTNIDVLSPPSPVSNNLTSAQPPQADNTQPVVIAGADKTVFSGEMVYMHASSYDPDCCDGNQAMKYKWLQSSGPLVNVWQSNGSDLADVADPFSQYVNFQAPPVSSNTDLEFSVQAIDDKGYFSKPDIVRVTVKPAAS